MIFHLRMRLFPLYNQSLYKQFNSPILGFFANVTLFPMSYGYTINQIVIFQD